MLPGAVFVDDPADERLADLIGLRDRELRTRSGAATPGRAVFVAEGDHVIARAAKAGYRMLSVLVDAQRDEPLPFELPDGAVLFAAAPHVVLRITGFGVHRGAAAVFERRPLATPAEVLGPARRVVMLERVVNPVNLGVIIRSAAALGIDAIALDDASVDPLYRRASRVAMGEGFALPYCRLGPPPESVDALRHHGFTLVALTPAADAEPIDEFRPGPDERVALCLGSEGPGLTDDLMAACDRRVRIPIAAGVDSLNVGAAAAIAFYAIGRV